MHALQPCLLADSAWHIVPQIERVERRWHDVLWCVFGALPILRGPYTRRSVCPQGGISCPCCVTIARIAINDPTTPGGNHVASKDVRGARTGHRAHGDGGRRRGTGQERSQLE